MLIRAESFILVLQPSWLSRHLNEMTKVCHFGSVDRSDLGMRYVIFSFLSRHESLIIFLRRDSINDNNDNNTNNNTNNTTTNNNCIDFPSLICYL